jgi:hypothetical protein
MLPAAAVLVFLACLTIAAVWNATESARAADQVRRSSTTLVQLATLRAAIAEARVSSSSEETRNKRSPELRARRAMRSLNRLYEGRPNDPAILDRLEALVRERTSLRVSVAPDRVALLDREIQRLSLEHETVHTARLAEASRQIETQSRQTVFLVAVLGILAAGTTAVAFQPPHR